jgi:hypothetical protein
MLVIRQTQLTSLGEANRVIYEEDLANHFLLTYPRECRQAGGRQQIYKLVLAGIERARELGFTDKTEISMFIGLQFILGAGFNTDPQLPWVRKILEDRKIRSAELRLRCVFSEAIEYLKATAGPKGQFIVRALVRVRDGDLASRAPAVDEWWKTNMLRLLRELYPQKFDYQREEANSLLLDDCLGTCDFFHHIQSREGKALFAILAFMLGSSFDRDHLHGWATRILSDRSFATEKDRVDALHSAALKHVAESLKDDGPASD